MVFFKILFTIFDTSFLYIINTATSDIWVFECHAYNITSDFFNIEYNKVKVRFVWYVEVWGAIITVIYLGNSGIMDL